MDAARIRFEGISAVNAEEGLPFASPQHAILLADLWTDLRTGRRQVVDCLATSARLYLVLTTRANSTRGTVRDLANMSALENCLWLGAQKVVAAKCGRSTSGVAGRAKSALASMGVRCSFFHSPFLLAASCGLCHLGDRSVFAELRSTGSADVVSVRRPEYLLGGITDAERQVAGCLLEGLPYAEIAKRRGVSTRTIANQLSAVFRGLHVSGRFELIRRALELWRCTLGSSSQVIRQLSWCDETGPR